MFENSPFTRTARNINRNFFCPFALLLSLSLWTGCANEVLKGQVESSQTKQNELATELAALQNQVHLQNAQNEDLIRTQAELEGQIRTSVTRLQQENEKLHLEQQKLLEERQTLLEQRDMLALRAEEAAMQPVIRNAAYERPADITIVPNNSEKRFRPTFDDPELLPPRYVNGNIQLELPDSVLFQTPVTLAAPQFSEQGRERLLRLAGELRRYYPAATWRIEGHVNGPFPDATGQDRAMDLSLQKAAAVANCLALDAGLPTQNMEVAGCGSSRNIVTSTNSSEAGRNNRIELILEP